MNVVHDPDRYAGIAGVLLRRFVKAVVQTLDQSDAVEFDTSNVSDKQLDLLYTICFSSLAQIEAFNALPFSQRNYFSYLTFADKLPTPQEFLTSDNRTLLHGGVSDELMRSVIAEVDAEKNKPAG